MAWDPSEMWSDWTEHRDQPEFARFTDSGAVHVLRRRWSDPHHQSFDVLTGVGKKPGEEVEHPIDWLYGKQTGLCGEVAPSPSLWGITSFADENLCVRCARIVPEEMRHRLFEHEIPRETED